MDWLERSRASTGERLALAHLLLQLTHVVFRNGEDHGDGLQLGNHGQGRGAGRRGQVARIDQAETDAAVNGRGDVGVTQLHLVELQGSLVGFDGALVLQDDLFLVFQGLFRDGIARPGILVALEVHFGLGQQVGVAVQVSLGGEHVGLVRPGIDLDQGLAAVHQLPFTVVHLGDDTGYLADQGGGIDRGDGADGVQVDADVAFFRGSDVQGDGAALGASPAATSRRGGLLAVHDPPEEQAKEDQDDHPDQDAHSRGATWRR